MYKASLSLVPSSVSSRAGYETRQVSEVGEGTHRGRKEGGTSVFYKTKLSDIYLGSPPHQL